MNESRPPSYPRFYCVLGLILAGLFITSPLKAQNEWNRKRDSLLKLIVSNLRDTNKALNLKNLAVMYLSNNHDSALYYAKESEEISESLHFLKGIALSLSLQAALMNQAKNRDQAILLDLKAIDIIKKTPFLKVQGNLYNNTAIIYSDMGNNMQALEYYLKAKEIYERINDQGLMALVYGNISSIYTALKEYEKGYEYSLKAVNLCHKNGTHNGLGSSLLNLSSALINFQKFDSALLVIKSCKEYYKQENLKDGFDKILVLECFAYQGLEKFSLLKKCAENLLIDASEEKDPYGIGFGYLNLSKYYLKTEDYKIAFKNIQFALKIGQEYDIKDLYRESLSIARKISVNRGDLISFYHYDQLMDSLDEIIYSGKILKNTQELESKYNLKQKQTEINELNQNQKIQELTLNQRKSTILILALLLIGIITTSLFYIRFIRQKRKLLLINTFVQENKIKDLEKEKQLMATRSLVQGQVEERIRLAKEMHDGLGTFLSSAKFAFSHLMNPNEPSQKLMKDYDKGMEIMDLCIHELRRITHNMMPEAIIKFGLDTALKDFCDLINKTGAIELTYQSFDMNEETLSKTSSITIYRIVQELVNNVLKHSEANQALVQLIRNGDNLSITIEDNGKGFVVQDLNLNSGLGYKNLKNRIEHLNGKMDIQSAEGKGTSIVIELNTKDS